MNYIAIISDGYRVHQWLTRPFTDPNELIPILLKLQKEEGKNYSSFAYLGSRIKELEDLSNSLGDFIELYERSFGVIVNWFKIEDDFTYIPDPQY